jgi:serine/threonine protein kinase
MRALMNIFNRDAPELNKYEDWSPEFRAFVEDCLQKDPTLRVSSDEILLKHKRFFDKAKDKTIIRSSIIEGRKPLIERIPNKVK